MFYLLRRIKSGSTVSHSSFAASDITLIHKKNIDTWLKNRRVPKILASGVPKDPRVPQRIEVYKLEREEQKENGDPMHEVCTKAGNLAHEDSQSGRKKIQRVEEKIRMKERARHPNQFCARTDEALSPLS